jgi:hypothetical protein
MPDEPQPPEPSATAPAPPAGEKISKINVATRSEIFLDYSMS